MHGFHARYMKFSVFTVAVLTATLMGLSVVLAQYGPADGFSDPHWEVLIFVIVGLIVFCIPSVIAFKRRHPNRWPILLINMIFGGTGLGWFGALMWAMSAVHRSPTGNHGGESGLNLFVNDVKTLRVSASDQQAGNDPVADLLRLKKLFDAGVVTADEYAAMRKPLLDRA